MVFGRTLTNEQEWHKVFLLVPRKLVDGRWAWLQTVERVSYYSNKVSPYTHCSVFSFGTWCYRL